MAKDWGAVASAIQQRLDELEMTQAELAIRAGVAQETVRELRTNSQVRRRSSRTLAAVSEALQWPSDRLANLLNGEQAPSVELGVGNELGAITEELRSIAGRLTEIAGRLDKVND